MTISKYYTPSCIQAISGEDEKVKKDMFFTRNGRKVYDKGGVLPDVITGKKSKFNLVNILKKENYALIYIKQNQRIDKSTFQLNKAGHENMIEKISLSGRLLNKLNGVQ